VTRGTTIASFDCYLNRCRTPVSRALAERCTHAARRYEPDKADIQLFIYH